MPSPALTLRYLTRGATYARDVPSPDVRVLATVRLRVRKVNGDARPIGIDIRQRLCQVIIGVAALVDAVKVRPP